MPPDEVLARFLRDLGVDGARVPVDAEERAALYRTRLAERQMLIVLDDARDAAQVRPLLPGTGSCAVIVTSRHRLSDLAGSRLIDLDVLDDGEAAELFTRIIGTERAEAEPDPVRDVLASLRGPAAGDQDRGRAAGRPPRLDRPDARRPPGRPAPPDGRAHRGRPGRAGLLPGQLRRPAAPQRATAAPTRPARSGCSASGRGRRSGCRRPPRSIGQPEWPGRPTRWRCSSTRTCWNPRPRTGTGCTTCCAPTRPSGPGPTSRRRRSRTRCAGCSTGTCAPRTRPRAWSRRTGSGCRSTRPEPGSVASRLRHPGAGAGLERAGAHQPGRRDPPGRVPGPARHRLEASRRRERMFRPPRLPHGVADHSPHCPG